LSRSTQLSASEAVSAFSDPLSITIADPDYSAGEERFILIGRPWASRLPIVVHVERGIRLRRISARVATRRERRHHDETASHGIALVSQSSSI
jgi:uncharacterized protein